MTLQCEHNNNGFTVVELMVAVVITVIAFAGLATMEIACINGNSIASNVTTGITLAQDKMEELKALAFSDPWLEAAGNPPGVDSAGNSHEQTTSDGYTVRWDVADNTPVPNTKRIVVTITGKGKTSRLTCMRADW